jgi:tRNA pseudouridine65 synthase
MFIDEFKCNNLFLHARSVKFTHPITLKDINIKANFPTDWLKIAELFDWKL